MPKPNSVFLPANLQCLLVEKKNLLKSFKNHQSIDRVIIQSPSRKPIAQSLAKN